MNRLLVIQIAALGWDFFGENEDSGKLAELDVHPLKTVFPAVTCTVQASFRTGLAPAEHGMVGNGIFSREVRRPFFWEQASALVQGPRIWDTFRKKGGSVGQLFWQQSIGDDSDLVLSPMPVHRHHGGMIEDCYSRPTSLYPRLKKEIGPFRLRHYWGPLASPQAGEWIAAATAAVMAGDAAPDLLLAYLPHLDYELQRSGPHAQRSQRDFLTLKKCLEKLVQSARENQYDVLLFSDYAITSVGRAILPNQTLLNQGLLRAREVDGMLYPDLHASPAFAMVDHQVAHVFCAPEAVGQAAEILGALEGVSAVLDAAGQKAAGIAHPRTGELVLTAAPGYWFAYPWWDHHRQAPDYARHVDIHNKPGYDPCELFFDTLPVRTSLDWTRIRGSHGILQETSQALFATSLPLPATPPKTLLELAAFTQQRLEFRT